MGTRGVDSARERLAIAGAPSRRLDALEAQQIGDALRAVAAAAAGEPFEHLLADLIDREPKLPPHLRQQHTGDPDHG